MGLSISSLWLDYRSAIDADTATIALEYIDAERHAGHSPDLSKTGDMFERMVVFVHRHIKVSAGGI